MKCKSKNKKVSFCEPVVAPNSVEKEKGEFDEYVLDECRDSYILGDEELKNLLENFNPLDFGIKEKLSESEKKILIKEIYGRIHVDCPTSDGKKKAAKKSDGSIKVLDEECTMKKGEAVEKDQLGGKNIKKKESVDEKQNEINSEKQNEINSEKQNEINSEKQNGTNSEKQNGTNSEKQNGTNNEKQKEQKKERKKVKRKEENLTYLDGDCYFPNDGYDYEQHLKPISTNFIEIKTKKKNNFFDIKPTDEEEKELFKTFDADNYEELNDNFVCEAQNVDRAEKLEIDDEIIWGTGDSFLPLVCTNNASSIEVRSVVDENTMRDWSSVNGNVRGSTNGSSKTEKREEESSTSVAFSPSSAMCCDKAFPIDSTSKGRTAFDESCHTGSTPKNNNTNNTILDSKKEEDVRRDERDLYSLKLSDFVQLELNKVDSKINSKNSKNNININSSGSNSNVDELTKVVKKKGKKKGKNCLRTADNLIVNIDTEEKNKILQILKLQKDEIVDDQVKSKSDYSEQEKSSSYNCETILTTKTNTTNHPYKLNIPKCIKSTPILNGAIGRTITKVKEANKMKEKNDDIIKLERYLVLEKVKTTRNKNETAEEKKERKKSVKEAQRLNRKLKKENSLLMKVSTLYITNEKKLMNKNNNPFDIRDNVKYIKL
ncbi:hypothetical protein, conserved [Plasmodium malariae]|uniref:Uncharacterized protein n=1 Tax=Plasmodium malariae TaxID=5858 RepID=A0A1A8VRK4_PLAMA|nr:hypothetical protein, conserved [Plasmodium malariae]